MIFSVFIFFWFRDRAQICFRICFRTIHNASHLTHFNAPSLHIRTINHSPIRCNSRIWPKRFFFGSHCEHSQKYWKKYFLLFRSISFAFENILKIYARRTCGKNEPARPSWNAILTVDSVEHWLYSPRQWNESFANVKLWIVSMPVRQISFMILTLLAWHSPTANRSLPMWSWRFRRECNNIPLVRRRFRWYCANSTRNAS